MKRQLPVLAVVAVLACLLGVVIGRATAPSTSDGGRDTVVDSDQATDSRESDEIGEYPNAATTGVPDDWQPSVVNEGEFRASTPGQVVDGYLITGDLLVQAPNVTIRNTRVHGRVWNWAAGPSPQPGLLLEDVEIGPDEGVIGGVPAVGEGSFTARRVHIHNFAEGFRAGGNCCRGEPITVEDSFVQLEQQPGADHHMDAVQGYDGTFATIRHNTLDARGPGSNAAVFINDNSVGATVVDNLMMGGTYVLRLHLDPAADYPEVTGNRIVTDTWDYGPADVDDCGSVGTWSDNRLVTIDDDYRIVDLGEPVDYC